ncbi:MAG: winged helix-turn-helix transcriptional regulator [Alphaproteobacteria bacterium]|nr:winged helix-turn-helix transcriptional regulator [Alphaproteobacteria bacterium]MBV9904703.1 winged helix-turn-helix transcriptional regulator [Alphaproteobacteria bacterium]
MARTAADPIFRALADPTRRHVLDVLRDGARSVTELLAEFRISQPALSRHLKVLRDARLVVFKRDGRLNLYQLNAEPMEAVHDWMQHYQEFWLGNFRALGDVLADEAKKKGD